MTLADELKQIKRSDIDYLIAHQYRDGSEIKELFSSPFLSRKLGKDASKWAVNIAAKPVTAVLSKLRVNGHTVKVNGKEVPAVTDAFKADIWDHNLMTQVIADGVSMAEEYGDSYLLVWDDLNPESDAVDVVAYSPVGARMFYDTETERRKLRWVRTWMVRGQGSTDDQTTWYRRVNVVDDLMVVKLIAREQGPGAGTEADFVPYTGDDAVVAAEDDTDAEQVVPSAPGVVLHEYGELPVFHLRNGRPYGTPEHRCLYGLQNLLIKDLATLAESIDGYGAPFRYRLLEANSALAPGTDVFDGNDGQAEQSRSDRVKTEAGALANLRNTTSVGQLSPSDVSNLLSPVDTFMALAATTSETPLDYFDPSAAAASGESKKEHKEAFNDKCQTRLDDFDVTLVDALEFAAIVVLQLGEGITVELEWEPIERQSPLDVAAQVRANIENGMPYVEAWVQAGWKREEVELWPEPPFVTAKRLEGLRSLAAATKDFAAAATLEFIDGAAVAKLVADATNPPKPAAIGS